MASGGGALRAEALAAARRRAPVSAATFSGSCPAGPGEEPGRSPRHPAADPIGRSSCKRSFLGTLHRRLAGAGAGRRGQQRPSPRLGAPASACVQGQAGSGRRVGATVPFPSRRPDFPAVAVLQGLLSPGTVELTSWFWFRFCLRRPVAFSGGSGVDSRSIPSENRRVLPKRQGRPAERNFSVKKGQRHFTFR